MGKREFLSLKGKRDENFEDFQVTGSARPALAV